MRLSDNANQSRDIQTLGVYRPKQGFLKQAANRPSDTRPVIKEGLQFE